MTAAAAAAAARAAGGTSADEERRAAEAAEGAELASMMRAQGWSEVRSSAVGSAVESAVEVHRASLNTPWRQPQPQPRRSLPAPQAQRKLISVSLVRKGRLRHQAKADGRSNARLMVARTDVAPFTDSFFQRPALKWLPAAVTATAAGAESN